MEKDLAKIIRKDFPILKTRAKDKTLVFLDNAATSQKPKEVIQAIKEFYESYNSNIHRGVYHIAEKATEKYENTRPLVADFIGAKNSSEIIFTSGTTEAINLVAFSWGGQNIHKGEEIITTIAEHHSNFVPWQQLAKRKQAKFLIAPILPDGTTDQKALLKMVSRKTKMIALALASNMLGVVNPVQSIIKRAKSKNPSIKIIVDAAQAAPHLKINVRQLNCDFLAFSGHKMLGPNGIGVLYAKKDILEEMPPFLFGGHMIKSVSTKEASFNDIPWKFEAGTQNIAGVIGLGAAINYLQGLSFPKIRKHLEMLTKYALKELQTIPGLEIYGTKNTQKKVSTIAFNVQGIHSHDLSQVLGDQNICIRSGHHCAMPLHHYLGLTDSARASFYIYNTKEEINKLVTGIIKAKKLLM